MVLTTHFYDKNWKILTKKGYFQNFAWFQYFFYKLCIIMCIAVSPLTTVLNKFSDTIIYGKNACISPWNNFCFIPVGKCIFKGRSINSCKKKSNFEFVESAFYLKSGSMPLNICVIYNHSPKKVHSRQTIAYKTLLNA